MQGVCLFCSCLLGWGSHMRDQLRLRPSRKVFVYFVVVYRVGVPYEGPALLEVIAQGASLSDVCLFIL